MGPDGVGAHALDVDQLPHRIPRIDPEETALKTAFAVLFATIAGAAMLPAQTGNQQSSSIFGFSSLAPRATTGDSQHTVVIVQRPVYLECPITMRAQHLSDGGLRNAGDAQHLSGIGQRLHLILVNPDKRTISSASVTVHGSSAEARIMRSESVHDSSALSRTLTLRFAAGDNLTAVANTWIAGMTSVQRIDLDSVTYTDGSNWKFAGNRACHVAPDGFMPVAER